MSTAPTTIFHAGQMRSQTVVLISLQRPPCHPGPHVYLGQTHLLGTLSPSLPTLLPQHRSPYHCCSSALGEPTPTSVYLPQSDQPCPSHSLSSSSSALILHGRSLKAHVPHPQRRRQPDWSDILSHNAHPGQVLSHYRAFACASLIA